jgi:hypothetical protein
VTGFTLNGNGQFTGVLVAPNADLALHGGGKTFRRPRPHSCPR